MPSLQVKNGLSILLIAVAGFASGVVVALFWDSLGMDFFMSEVLISPDGNFRAARFEEMGAFAICNEVVIVTSINESFNPKRPEQYIPSMVFGTSCSTRTRIQWTGVNKLLIAYDRGDDGRKSDDPSFHKTDLSGKVAIVYRALTQEAMRKFNSN